MCLIVKCLSGHEHCEWHGHFRVIKKKAQEFHKYAQSYTFPCIHILLHQLARNKRQRFIIFESILLQSLHLPQISPKTKFLGVRLPENFGIFMKNFRIFRVILPRKIRVMTQIETPLVTILEYKIQLKKGFLRANLEIHFVFTKIEAHFFKYTSWRPEVCRHEVRDSSLVVSVTVLTHPGNYTV